MASLHSHHTFVCLALPCVVPCVLGTHTWRADTGGHVVQMYLRRHDEEQQETDRGEAASGAIHFSVSHLESPPLPSNHDTPSEPAFPAAVSPESASHAQGVCGGEMSGGECAGQKKGGEGEFEGEGEGLGESMFATFFFPHKTAIKD